mgnify:CR=1 FL=1
MWVARVAVCWLRQRGDPIFDEMRDSAYVRGHDRHAARQRFEKELAAVPSPAAVILRVAPLFAACLGLLLALPARSNSD